jgi:hypothetical protein
MRKLRWFLNEVRVGWRQGWRQVRLEARGGSIPSRNDGPCPTCSGTVRETVGMVCQTCGTDYGHA